MIRVKKTIKWLLGKPTIEKFGRYRSILSEEDSYNKWLKTPSGIENRRRLSQLRGIHSGQAGFVIGNGPSLKKIDVGLLNNQITIGSNSIFLLHESTGFMPMYYTVEDHLVAEDRGERICQLSNTRRIVPFDLRERFAETDTLFVNFRRSYIGFPRFSDAIEKRAYWGGTVTFFNLQLAVFLGCNPIYLIGVDHSYKTDVPVEKNGAQWTSLGDDPNHFHPDYFGKGYRWHDPDVDRMEQAYRCAQAYAAKTNIKIVNATIGGRLEVFPRMEFNTISLKQIA